MHDAHSIDDYNATTTRISHLRLVRSTRSVYVTC